MILLPFITTLLPAFTLMLPLPSKVMSFPLIVIVPSFFIAMLASPVVIVISSPASIMIDANDTQARAVYDSIWPLMRKLLPSMTTISAWCSSRSRMAEVKVLSLLNILGHSLNARFEVSMIEPCS